MLQSRDKKSNSNIRRGDNSKVKKAKVVILVCDMLSGPILHYYQVSSKHSKECSTYIADTKSMHNQCQQANSMENLCPPPYFYLRC